MKNKPVEKKCCTICKCIHKPYGNIESPVCVNKGCPCHSGKWEDLLDDALTSPATGLVYISGDGKRAIVKAIRAFIESQLLAERKRVVDKVIEMIGEREWGKEANCLACIESIETQLKTLKSK